MNSLNQNPCLPLWSDVFQFSIFLSVALSESMCMSTSGPSLKSCYSFLYKLFVFYALLLCSFCSHILLRNNIVSFAFDCWFVLVHFPPTCKLNILSLFWNALFCLYRFTLSQYLLSLCFFTNIFWFMSSSYIVCLVCCFLFLVLKDGSFGEFFFSHDFLLNIFFLFSCIWGVALGCMQFWFSVFSVSMLVYRYTTHIKVCNDTVFKWMFVLVRSQ